MADAISRDSPSDHRKPVMLGDAGIWKFLLLWRTPSPQRPIPTRRIQYIDHDSPHNITPSSNRSGLWSMICSGCGYENLSGARFCGDCGRGLQLDVVCESCSTANPDGYSFCDACGQPITEQRRSTVTATTDKKSALVQDVLALARTRLQTMGTVGWETATLICIILLALALRLISLTNIPPNVQADEADNLQIIFPFC